MTSVQIALTFWTECLALSNYLCDFVNLLTFHRSGNLDSHQPVSGTKQGLLILSIY